MAKVVFFHVGAPKTGTTFLQTIMWKNRPVLQELGVLYPGRNRMEHYYASEAIRGRMHRRVPGAAMAWDRLLSSVRQWPETAVISHEFFGMATADEARKALADLAPADVHIVFTARDYVRQFPAVWQEALKMSCDLSLTEFTQLALKDELTGPWSWSSQDIVAILERWGKQLSPEKVHIVTVPPSGAPRDTLWRRYAGLIGIDPDLCDTDLALSNESLGVREAALLHRIKPRLVPPLTTKLHERYRWVRGFLAQEVLALQYSPRLALRPEDVSAFRDKALADVASLRASGYHVVGDLDELIPQVSTTQSPHPDDVTDSEMLDASLDAIVQLVVRYRAVVKERDRLRTERAGLRTPQSRRQEQARHLQQKRQDSTTTAPHPVPAWSVAERLRTSDNALAPRLSATLRKLRPRRS